MGTAALTSTVSADMLLARISVCTPAWLGKLVCISARDLIEQIDRLDEELEMLKPDVIDLLFSCVPHLGESQDLVRFTIHLKRDLFNDRLREVHPGKAGQLMEHMDQQEAIRFQRFLEAFMTRQQLKEELNRTVEEESGEIKNQVVAFLQSAESREWMVGVAMASPELLQMVSKSQREMKQFGSNFAKSIYMYLQRGMIKTSPFSTFTKIASAYFSFQESEDAGKDQRSYIRLNRALLSTLIEQMSRHPELSPYFRYTFTDCAWVEGKVSRFKSGYMFSNQFFWKTEQLVSNNSLLSQIPESINLEPFTFMQLEESLRSTTNPVYLQKLLISMKLLRPVVPFPLEEKEPLAKLAEWLTSIRSDTADKLAEQLNQMNREYYKLGEHNTCFERVEVLRRLKSSAKSCFNHLNHSAPDWIDQANVVYEDVKSDHQIPPLGDDIRQDLEKLSQFVLPYVQFTALYGEIVDAYKQSFGAGTVTPLLDFLGTVAGNEHRLASMLQRANQRDFISGPGRRRLGKCISPPTASVYFQIVADNYESVQRGEYRFVVNKVSTGIGSVVSRFNPVVQERTYSRSIAGWIQDLFPETRPIELSMGGDWSNLQENFGVLDGHMQWLGELKYGSAGIQAGSLHVRHCTKTDTLDIIDSYGRLVSPVYIGTVPQFLIQGAGKILLTLVNPWTVNTPFGINPRPWEKILGDKLIHHPRETDGRLVLNRAKWIVPVELLPPFTGKEHEADRMLIFHRWAASHNMPDELFFTVIDEKGSTQKKPVWIHLKSTYSLEVLRKSLKDNVKGIMLTEALPAHNQQWFADGTDRGLSTEFIALSKIYTG